MNKHRQNKERRRASRVLAFLISILMITALIIPIGVKASETADGSASGVSAQAAAQEEVEEQDSSASDAEKEENNSQDTEAEKKANEENNTVQKTDESEKESKDDSASDNIPNNIEDKSDDRIQNSDPVDSESAPSDSTDEATATGSKTDETEMQDTSKDVDKSGFQDTTATSETLQSDMASTEEGSPEVSNLEETYSAGQLTFIGPDFKVIATYEEEAHIPSDVVLSVKEITEKQNSFQKYFEEAEKVVEEKASDKNEKVIDARFFDITIMKDGKEIQPAKPLKVRIEFSKEIADNLQDDKKDVKTVHFGDDVDLLDTVVQDGKNKDNTVSFEAKSFSVYGVLTTEVVSGDFFSTDGKNFHIDVTLDERDRAPLNASLSVKEITEETDSFDQYLNAAIESIDIEGFEASYVRFFDISILDQDGKKYEPDYPAKIVISHNDAIELEENEQLKIVHFGEKETEVIEDVSLQAEGREVTYMQSGFSVTGEVAGAISDSSWPSVTSGDYILVVNKGSSGPYYAVHSDGSLTEVSYDSSTGEVTFSDAESLDDINNYWWTYQASGTMHRLTSKTNSNRRIYPSNGSALSNTNSSPSANQGYITAGNNNNRYCVAMNSAGTGLTGSRVSYTWGIYSYPDSAVHFQFANGFEVDISDAYGTAASTILTGNSKTLRVSEVTTESGESIDFEGFSWSSSNTSVVTVTTDPDTDAPVASAVKAGSAKIIGTRTNEAGDTEKVIWTITVKDKTSNSIVFLHQEQSNSSFANQDSYRPHDGFGNSEPTNYIKFIVVLADENGAIITYNGNPSVELPEGSIVPERYEFDLDSSSVLEIGQDTLSGISVPGYSYAGTYAYFGWLNNTDLRNMAVVDNFKNLGKVSTNHSDYLSVLGFKTSRGNPGYDDYSQATFGSAGYGYYAYNPTGCLMIVLQPVSEDISYRTSYHNEYNPGGTPVTNIVDTTNARMIKGDWISGENRYDWYGETIMTDLEEEDLTAPADGYEFVGWFDSVDSEGNGTGNQITGQTEEGFFYALKDGEKIIIRQNNDIYARWQLVRGTLTVKKEIVGDLSEEELNTLKRNLQFTITKKSDQSDSRDVSAIDMTWTDRAGIKDISGLSVKESYIVTETNDGTSDLDAYNVKTEIIYPAGYSAETGVTVSKTEKTTVLVKNTYTRKNTEVKVKKVVTGNMADTGKEFSFTYTINNVPGAEGFTLSNGEEYTIGDIPIGAVLVITETGAEDYTTSIIATDNNDAEIGRSTASDSKEYTLNVPDKGAVVTFTNNKTAVAPTQLYSGTRPMAVLVVFGLGAMILLAAHHFKDKLRNSNNM